MITSWRDFIGQRIIHQRRQRDWSRRELSRRTGIPMSSLTNYEHGERELPISKAIEISEAFQIPIEELVGPRRSDEEY